MQLIICSACAATYELQLVTYYFTYTVHQRSFVSVPRTTFGVSIVNVIDTVPMHAVDSVTRFGWAQQLKKVISAATEREGDRSATHLDCKTAVKGDVA